MRHAPALIIAAVGMLLGVSSTAQEPARIALLIGNKAYTDKVGPLKNPHNDVTVVEASLKRLQFKVTVVRDADYKQMDIAIKRHIGEVRKAGPGTISFLYYTGHGAANPETQINYLIPVDVQDARDQNLWYSSFEQTDLVDKLSKQAPLGLHYVVFDACRNELQLPAPAAKNVGGPDKGFVPVAQTNGVLVAYATAPKQTASDVGEGSGPYARALAEEILKPGVEVVAMFFNVHRRVKQAIGQDPWLSAPVLPEIFLAGRPTDAATGAARQSNPIEVAEFCQKISTITDAGVVESLVDSYRDSPMAGCANARLEALKRRQVAAAPTVKKVEAVPAERPENKDFSTVDIFYGTDRNRADSPAKLGFGSDRSRRLELGKAVVTVPRLSGPANLERPWAYRIPFSNVSVYQQQEDPKRHFTLQEIGGTTVGEAAAAIRQKLQRASRFKDHVLVFVHGYNVTFDYAVFRAAHVAYNMQFDGAMLAYSWPSGSSVTSYPYDRESVQQAEPYFVKFIEMILRETPARHVSILAHSMGSSLVMSALREIGRNSEAKRKLAEVILVAPDMDREAMTFIVSQVKDNVRGITLYASSNDLGLSVSKRFSGAPRAGDVDQAAGALVIPGVDTIDISPLTTDLMALNQATFSDGSALLQDIEQLIATSRRPPGVRLPILQRIESPSGTYWRYPAR